MTATLVRLGKLAVSYSYRALLALLLLCLLVFLGTIPLPRVDNQLIGSDGVGYYVYLRSWILDRDLDFSNEYTYFYGPVATTKFPRTATRRLPNQYAIGSALLWSPFFLAAHAMALLGQLAGFPVRADGYGYLYQAAICFGSMVYSFLGLVLAFRLASRYATSQAALAATALIWLGSNVLYYMVVEPSMAHMNSLFAVSLFLYAWEAGRGSLEPKRWLGLGLLAGLMALVRTQDGLFILAPLWELAEVALPWRKTNVKRRLSSVSMAGLLLVGGALAAFLPQMAVW